MLKAIKKSVLLDQWSVKHFLPLETSIWCRWGLRADVQRKGRTGKMANGHHHHHRPQQQCLQWHLLIAFSVLAELSHLWSDLIAAHVCLQQALYSGGRHGSGGSGDENLSPAKLPHKSAFSPLVHYSHRKVQESGTLVWAVKCVCVCDFPSVCVWGKEKPEGLCWPCVGHMCPLSLCFSEKKF